MDNHISGVTSNRSLKKEALLRLLDQLDAAVVTNPVTMYIRGAEDYSDTSSTEEYQTDLKDIVQHTDFREASVAIFQSLEHSFVILPPFPIEHTGRSEGWDTSHLRSLFSSDCLFGVVLIRLGKFAVGICRGNTLISSKTGARYVKGRHRAGGTSQMRFQRVREKQIEEMFKKTCSVVRGQFDPHGEHLKHIFLGGERLTLNSFRKHCDYLRTFATCIRSRILNVRTPNHQELLEAIDMIWETQVVIIKH